MDTVDNAEKTACHPVLTASQLKIAMAANQRTAVRNHRHLRRVAGAAAGRIANRVGWWSARLLTGVASRNFEWSADQHDAIMFSQKSLLLSQNGHITWQTFAHLL